MASAGVGSRQAVASSASSGGSGGRRETASPSSNEGSAFAPGSSGPGLPPVSLPSGGGAIRGMGENFSVNAASGSAGLTIPLPFSPSRQGTAPSLSLGYGTQGGGSAWGLGWDLDGLPRITRSVHLGNPTYDDAADRDIFNLSGQEDLVPVYSQCALGTTRSQAQHAAAGTEFSILEDRREGAFLVRFYRPRIEGSFYRIERWTDEVDPEDVHWRVFTPANELTIFGRNDDLLHCGWPEEDLLVAML